MLRTLLIAMTLFAFHSTCPADDGEASPYRIETHRYTGGPYRDESFRYLVMGPENIEPNKEYPLVLFLHGAGERGDDTKALHAHFLSQMASPEMRRKVPCFVVVPQCRKDKQWTNARWGDVESTPMAERPSHQLQAAIEILQKSIESLPVDKRRIYLTGLSMGGYGTWELAMRHPDWFAAVVPICGGGDENQAAKLRDVPVWVVHGAKDKAVLVERSRKMIAAIKKSGGQPKYTEYPEEGHHSWVPAYQDPNGVIPWMFDQKKPTKNQD